MKNDLYFSFTNIHKLCKFFASPAIVNNDVVYKLIISLVMSFVIFLNYMGENVMGSKYKPYAHPVHQ